MSVAASLNAGLEGKPLDPNALVTCQHIGCDAKYTEANNPVGCCVFHPGMPVFHDGMKEWSCCKKRSHDFGEFMSIKGCATGQHTQEKPQKPAAPAPAKPAIPIAAVPAAAAAPLDPADPKLTCVRCKQGFFCSDHQGGPKVVGLMPQKAVPPPPPKAAPADVDPNAEQTCKRKACGLKFKEKDNHNLACKFHPGPPVFHERKKGWGCCDVHSHDFDEFLKIPPCATGRHSAYDD